MNRRPLPMLQTLIASPCEVPWASMEGDERKRHCGQCSRDVHNLSAMTQIEIETFLDTIAPDATGHLPCISLFKRKDGTVLTADCPVGLRARRRRALLTSTLGAGAVALVAMTALATLWLDQKREVLVDTTPEAPTVFVPVAPAYPPPLPPTLTETPGVPMGGVHMAGGLRPLPPPKEIPTKPQPKVAQKPKPQPDGLPRSRQ